MSAQPSHTPVCVIVGVGPGNGAAFARRFAAEGYAVALLARSSGLTSGLASELPLARAYACDVGDLAAVAMWVTWPQWSGPSNPSNRTSDLSMSLFTMRARGFGAPSRR